MILRVGVGVDLEPTIVAVGSVVADVAKIAVKSPKTWARASSL